MRWFSISATATRKEALAVAAVTFSLSLLVWLLTISADWWPLARYVAPLAGIAWAALIATLIRRLHDIGRSGAWVLVILAALPWVGALLIAVLIWHPTAKRTHQPSLIGAVLGGTLIGLALAVAAASFVWRPMHVISAEMKPGLWIGDRVLLRQNRAEGLERGDLVALRLPGSGAEKVFRVIGLPGDRVEMRGGRLILNGALIPQRRAADFVETYLPQGPHHLLPRCRTQVGLGGACASDRIVETLPEDRRYAVLDHDTRAGAPDNMAEVMVPEGAVFVLGDHRDGALDSRFAVRAGGLGLVPMENILGQVDLVLFSSPSNQTINVWLWRMGRVLLRPDRIEAL